jgi:hypothetical protein
MVVKVSITCGGGKYVSQYTVGGNRWQPDPKKTGCTTDKLEILKICQRLYPNKDVTNIVESTKNVKLEKLCKMNKRGQQVKCERVNSNNNQVETNFFRCLGELLTFCIY